MFQHRRGGDGGRRLPIAAKGLAGFELHNYRITKGLRSFLPPPIRFQSAFWTELSGTAIWHKSLALNEKSPSSKTTMGFLSHQIGATGFEPVSEIDATANGFCGCDFCQGYRAANACILGTLPVSTCRRLTPICNG